MPPENFALSMGEAISRSGQPKPALECLCASYQAIVGCDLFTATLLKQPSRAGQTITSGYRMYSTMLKSHPAVAQVSFENTEWVDAMIVKKHILVMDTVEQYRRYYEAWAVLQQAGLLSAVNIPIVVNDAVIGTINLMSRTESYFSAERLAAAKQLYAVSALTVMLCSQFQRF
jgi:transcriptional regulator with GAF, ATPase, and Fis domain